MKAIKLIQMNAESVQVDVSGRVFHLLPHTFAALSADPNDPLFCVSVANNSFSIDPWKGCPFNCAYCHVQGCYEDLHNWTNCYKPERRSRFSEEEIVSALKAHPWFIPDKSIISIGTSSTEPLLGEEMINSTLDVMNAFVKMGLKNPFWIVTKVGFPDRDYIDAFRTIRLAGNPIVISICWGDNPPSIEPTTANRFRNLDLAREIGVHINWYMRPLCDEWNTSEEKLTAMTEAVREYAQYIDSISPGGLRWTEGVEFGIWAVHDLPMPELTREDNVKTLSEDCINRIKSVVGHAFPDKPLFFKSSCTLCYSLGMENFNLVDLLEPDSCQLSLCPESQRQICRKRRIQVGEQLRETCKTLGFSLSEENGVLSITRIRKTSYQENEIVRKMISFSE